MPKLDGADAVTCRRIADRLHTTMSLNAQRPSDEIVNNGAAVTRNRQTVEAGSDTKFRMAINKAFFNFERQSYEWIREKLIRKLLSKADKSRASSLGENGRGASF